MTCIAGIARDGVVTIGGDSMGSAGCDYDLIRSPKVVRVGGLIIGCSGSSRVADIVRYWLDAPEPDGDDMMRYMVRQFVPALRTALAASGFPLDSGEDRHSWALLVGVGGGLFAVFDDFQVEETVTGSTAIGCANRIAVGALYALGEFEKSLSLPARSVVRIVLEAAEAADTHVRAPFVILSSDDK